LVRGGEKVRCAGSLMRRGGENGIKNTFTPLDSGPAGSERGAPYVTGAKFGPGTAA